MPGRTVRFYVGSRLMHPIAAWNSKRVWELSLSPASVEPVYLPLIFKQR